MRIVDLTRPIKSLNTPMFPGYPQPLRTVLTTIEEHGYRSHVWTLVEHTSTHVDAPAHFVSGGTTIDEMPLETFVGWGTAIDMSFKEPESLITRRELEERIEELRRRGIDVGEGWVLIIHTGYGDKAGTPEWFRHPGLSEDACRYLLELGIKAVGVDAPSPDRDPFPAHRLLLPRGVAIYENLANTDKIVGTKFLFVGAPLKLERGTASPVRALAIYLE